MIKRAFDNKMAEFENYCDLFNLRDIPLNPPKLLRSYKALCLCGNITHVYNKEREGGICYYCEKGVKRSKL